MFEGERLAVAATEFCVLSKAILGAEVVLLRSAGDMSVRILDIHTEVCEDPTSGASPSSNPDCKVLFSISPQLFCYLLRVYNSVFMRL